MLIIPAVDLHQGKCVRLTQGRLDQETIYSSDPVFVSRLWQSKGAKLLHLVDLTGAHCGTVQHWDVIKKIREELTIPIEFGGGVRKLKTVEKLDEIGIDRIIISTVILRDPPEATSIIKKFKDRIVVAVDMYEKKVAVGGWKEQTSLTAEEFIKKVVDMGVKEIILTDITREGMLEGVDISSLIDVLEKIKDTGIKIIISGGITTLEDIKNIKQLKPYGVYGVIVGKALYTEKFTFEDALKVASG